MKVLRPKGTTQHFAIAKLFDEPIFGIMAVVIRILIEAVKPNREGASTLEYLAYIDMFHISEILHPALHLRWSSDLVHTTNKDIFILPSLNIWPLWGFICITLGGSGGRDHAIGWE